MKKRLITLIAIGALIGAVQTGTAQDTAAYLVMIANQGTQISNQVQTLMRMDTHITQLTGQFEHLKESALGQIGAIADPIADLVAVPTDLLNTTRDWHSDFTGQAGSLIDALTGLSAGTSLSESWRDVLETADTVTEATFGISIRAAGLTMRFGPSSVAGTTRIAVWSWPMPRPMPRRLLQPPRSKRKRRSTPLPERTMFRPRRYSKRSWPGISRRDNF